MADVTKGQLSWALARILELEELLADLNDTIARFADGKSVEWEWDE